jgi:diacylglycerol kinase
MSQSTKPPTEYVSHALPPEHKNKSELAKFIASFGYAFQGIWYTLRTQRNARVHACAALIVILMGIFLHISTIEFAIIFMAIGAVFVCEMFNTVLELCVDLASPVYHPLAKHAKDAAAGAVLVAAMIAVIIGLCIFLPHLLPLIIHFI